MRLHVPAAAFLILCANRTEAVGQVPAMSAVGCWKVAVGDWHPSPGGDSVLYSRPTWLRLTTDSVPEIQYFAAERSPKAPPQTLAENLKYLRAFWKPLSRDSIEVWLPVWWSTGVRARLAVRDSTLSGDAHIYVDFPNGDPTAVFRASRVDCSGGT